MVATSKDVRRGENIRNNQMRVKRSIIGHARKQGKTYFEDAASVGKRSGSHALPDMAIFQPVSVRQKVLHLYRNTQLVFSKPVPIFHLKMIGYHKISTTRG